MTSTTDAPGSTPCAPERPSWCFGEGVDRICRDIPGSACSEQPRNVGTHLIGVTSTRTGRCARRGTFGASSDVIGRSWLFVVFAAMSAIAGTVSLGLDEVQERDQQIGGDDRR